MNGRTRLSPVLGAVIAAALTTYAASQASRPALPEHPAPRRPAAPGWFAILGRVWAEIDRDHVSMMAAGFAFYALLSIFPGLSAAISVFGLMADPMLIESRINTLSGVLPGEALKLISDQVHTLVSAPPTRLGIGLAISLALALWSAASGASMLMQTLTIAYEQQDDRGVLGFYGRAFGLTIAVIVFGIIALVLVAGVPAVLSWLPLSEAGRNLLSLVRWPILAVLVLGGLAFVYRFAPRRQDPRWDLLNIGTLGATLLWLIGSAGFSFYVANFGSYDKTYGSIGAVVILLVWFYLTGYIILAGAELNAEMLKSRGAG